MADKMIAFVEIIKNNPQMMELMNQIPEAKEFLDDETLIGGLKEEMVKESSMSGNIKVKELEQAKKKNEEEKKNLVKINDQLTHKNKLQEKKILDKDKKLN